MPRKIIIDCDLGIDDAAVLAAALFDPRLEVLAVTACSGVVEADRSTQNSKRSSRCSTHPDILESVQPPTPMMPQSAMVEVFTVKMD